MELYLATTSEHKRREIAQLFPGHTIVLPKDKGFDYHHEETAQTFMDNALGKARTLFRLTGKPVLADDSGICIQALGGAPGLYSARFGLEEAGRTLSDHEKNLLVLEKMVGVEDRRAHYVCSLVLVLGDDRFFVAQETWHGLIWHREEGEGGFGYDPVFYLPEMNKTGAQLTPEEKNRISHRGKAAFRLRALMEGLDHHE